MHSCSPGVCPVLCGVLGSIVRDEVMPTLVALVAAGSDETLALGPLIYLCACGVCVCVCVCVCGCVRACVCVCVCKTIFKL